MVSFTSQEKLLKYDDQKITVKQEEIRMREYKKTVETNCYERIIEQKTRMETADQTRTTPLPEIREKTVSMRRRREKDIEQKEDEKLEEVRSDDSG